MNIQNTVSLIDKLYADRNLGEEFLNSIKVSEIVYFFNYIKVFYNEAYEDIIRLNGVEEYFEFLEKKNKKIEKEYFTAIFDDLIPTSIDKPQYSHQEIQKLTRTNTLKLIKDLFIDYYFTMNNINLLTDSQKCLEEAYNNKISIEKPDLETLKAYQTNIFKEFQNEDKTLIRVKNFSGYLEVLFKEEKIQIKDILSLTEELNGEYIEYYLKKVEKLIKENTLNIKNTLKVELIRPNLEKISRNNVLYNRRGIVELVKLATVRKNGNYDMAEIKKIFLDTLSMEEFVRRLAEYCTNNDIINDNSNLNNIKLITDNLLANSNFNNVDLFGKLLKENINKFVVNYEIISYLLNFEFNNYEKSEDKKLPIDLTSLNINEIIENLLNSNELDKDNIDLLNKLIENIINRNEIQNLDNTCKKNLKNLYIRIVEKDNFNFHMYFDNLIMLEEILNYKNYNEKNNKINLEVE